MQAPFQEGGEYNQAAAVREKIFLGVLKRESWSMSFGDMSV
jgi:hypothetical protein